MLNTKNGIYFVKSGPEHTKADSAAFVKDLDSYRSRMINLARQNRVRSHRRGAAAVAKVEDDRKKVLQQAGPAAQS